jgi:hypothetical protein
MAKAGGYGGRHAPAMSAVCGGSRLGPTFELTPTAEAGRLARAVQHKPARRAGKTACRSGSGAERGVMPHSAGAGEVGYSCLHATEATPSRLTAEQGRYSAAAGHAMDERLAQRGAASARGLDL